MILTADGKTGWPVSVAKRLWNSWNSKAKCFLLNERRRRDLVKMERRILRGQ